MANPYLVGFQANASPSATVVTAVTTAPAAGDAVFALFLTNASGTVFSSLADTQGGTWALVVQNVTAGQFTTYAYRRTAGPALTTSDTVTFTATTTENDGMALVGVPGFVSVDQTGTGGGASGTSVSAVTGGATSQAGEAGIAIFTTSSTGGVLTWTSWTPLHAGTQCGGPWINVAWAQLGAAGTVTAAGTTAVSGNWGGVVFTVIQAVPVSSADTASGAEGTPAIGVGPPVTARAWVYA